MAHNQEELNSFIEYAKRLSPFELKDTLIHMAKQTEQLGTYTFLNAGRGNPNWTAATPREAFFSLGFFAVSETKSVMQDNDLAGIPYKEGIAKRFYEYAMINHTLPAMDLLKAIIDYGIDKYQFEPDEWVY